VSKRLRFVPALGAVFFASLALTACGGGVPGDAVVQVGSNPITKTTFEHWLSVAAASSATTAAKTTKPVVPDPPNYTECIAHLEATAAKPAKGQAKPTTAELKSECEQQYTSLKQEVLGFLISSEWVIGEASHLGVKVSDAEVKKEFEKIKNEQFPKAAEFEKFLASSGQTVSDLLLRVKLNMLSSKIQQKIAKGKGTPSKAEIEKYYKENQSRFGTPEKRNVSIILTKTEAQAKEAKKEIESGKSFASVAKSKSIDPTSKATGGELKGVVKGQEEAALNTAIFSAPLNKLSGPVKTPFGYYIYEVKSSTPGNQQTLAQSEASIKQQLTATQQQAALSKFVKEFKKTWTAKTDCREGYVVMDCKQYKAPKTSSTGTSTGTAVPQTSTGSTPAPTTTTK
jgi:foldase protein PrsA